MANYRLKKGFTIKIKGAPAAEVVDASRPSQIALKPTDFRGIKPKLVVKEGDTVKVGSPLFFDKNNPEVQFTSSVSGKVVAIVRGDRRAILEVVVESDGSNSSESFDQFSAEELLKTSGDKVLANLLKSGLFPSFVSRPFGVLADPTLKPRDIFISAYYTNPLAPSIDVILGGNEEAFQAGINALTRLTDGKVYVSIEGDGKAPKSLQSIENAEVNTFVGQHPAGNVGVQIHHIKPINTGDTVWTLSPESVIRMGKLFQTGQLNPETIVAVGGECANERKHYKTILGAQISSILEGNVNIGNPVRFISGDVLTGTKIEADGYLSYADNLISIIPEMTQKEFVGWMSPGFTKQSLSPTFLSQFFCVREFSHNTGIHGGVRALVKTGDYEAVLPMKLYPQHLIKSIMCEDIEDMEALGILEVIEEDLALCEYVCLSKTEVQKILRDGLDFYQKETA